ncbi:hypothetical protein Moror_16051 [Moniliophthora roreri MCA 2997]|uniref:Uncharacterized protein n=2 Tax=Moniliophthora roreri TaxID=221103 RepID=V2YLT7_MONRO|nr:hypothetical protein Moror_16051 [Moniliophthora roreri MCA 2997]KAI3612936.1 hypothetical protein WG66_005353 [Moniliophthora roreri]
MATSRPYKVDIPSSLEPNDEWKRQLMQRIANALEFSADQIIDGQTQFSRFHEEFGGIGAQAVREYEEAAKKVMKLARDTYAMEEAREQHRCIDERRKELCAKEPTSELEQLGKACRVRRMVSKENFARAGKQMHRDTGASSSPYAKPTPHALHANLDRREEVLRQKEEEFLEREYRQERERELIRAMVATVKEQEEELVRLRGAMNEMAVKMDFVLEEMSEQRTRRRYQTVKIPDFRLDERSNVSRRLDEIFLSEHPKASSGSRSSGKSLKHSQNFHRATKRP